MLYFINVVSFIACLRKKGNETAMSVILGIDIGTSSVKAMLLDIESGPLAVRAKEYGVNIPSPGFAEQNPELWWTSLKEVLSELQSAMPEAYKAVAAVGYSGQMHGLVLVDRAGVPVRPAIIWLDQRSRQQVEEINHNITEKEMGDVFCNRVSSGFAFPSLLWVRENEPEVFSKAAAVLCPKDYLRMKMSGELGAEVVDASSTCIFSTADRDWAWDIIDRFGLPRSLFPEAGESIQIAGIVTSVCTEETGLPGGIPVIYGTGDQPAQSIGNGIFSEGQLISNIGTGGQISAFTKKPVYDLQLRTNTFCHAVPGGYTIFGATLCSGMSMNWAKNKLFHLDGYDIVNQEAARVPAGSEGLIYLPYLSGERTPHMNPDAEGMFFGLKLVHERGHFLRAVMEGVTYSLRDCLELMQELGIDAQTIIASGGGASSPLWLQIQADIFHKPVRACTVKEQACLGACILAAVGTGILTSMKEGCDRFVTMSDRIYEPDMDNYGVYEERYRTFRQLYQQTWNLMIG